MGKASSAPRAAFIFLAQLVSVAGDKMFAIALSWWVISNAALPHPEWTLGLLLAASSLSSAVSGPFWGRLIDRHDKRLCMVLADVSRLLLMSALAWLAHDGGLTLPRLFALCLPLFAFEPLFDSAVSASLASFADSPPMLARWVALESAIPNLGAVLGALLGSFALAAGVEAAFWFNAGTFLVSCLLVSGLPALPACTEPQEADDEALSLSKRYPEAVRLLVLFGAINFFLVPVFLYLPLLVRDVLSADGSRLSLLELALATGNLLVFGCFALWPREFPRIRRLRFFLVALSALFMWGLGVAESIEAMLAILFVWGGALAFVTYLMFSSFQRNIADSHKGRFFGTLTSALTLGFPLSFACFGLLLSRFPLPTVIVGNAACVALVSLAFLTIPDR